MTKTQSESVVARESQQFCYVCALPRGAEDHRLLDHPNWHEFVTPPKARESQDTQSFKCCNCTRIVDGVPFKVFGHSYSYWRGGNDGTGHGRKSVAWCEECWKATEAQDAANRSAREAEIQQVIAEQALRLAQGGQ